MILFWWRLYESERQKKYSKDTSPQLRGGGWLWVQAFLHLLFWSHLILPEKWADPISSGLISLDLTHSSLISLLIPTLYHLWPKVFLCARHSQCAGVCGSLQGAWRCFAGHRFNLILSKPGTCLFHGGRWDFIFCPFSPQSHWPIHDLANLNQ